MNKGECDMKSYVELGNRYITRKRMRAFLVVISMVLASMLIYVAVTAGLGTFMHEREQQEAWENYYVEYSNLSDEQYDTLKNYANVDSSVRGGSAGAEQREALGGDYVDIIPKNYYSWYGFRLLELETFDQDIFACNLLEGHMPENGNEILLCEKAVHRFTEEIKVGDTIVMNFDVQFYDSNKTGKTISKEYVLCGIYESPGEDYGLSTAYTLAEDTEGLTTYVRFHKKYSWRKDANALADALGVEMDQWGKRFYLNGYLSSLYLQDELTFSMFLALLMFAVLLIYFCMVMVRSLMSTNVINKLRDFTILKSMGATNKQLRRIMMRESRLEGCIAFVIGAVAGQLFLSLFLVKYCQLYSLSFKYIWAALLINALFLWLTIELASIEPFIMLKKVSIVEALGQQELIKKSGKKKKEGFLYKRMSIEGQYAYKNMKRNRKSFWNSVAAFTISVLIITTMMAVISNLGFEMADMTVSGGLVMNEEYAYDVYVDLGCDEDGKIDAAYIKKAKAAMEMREDVTAVEYQTSTVVAQDVTNGLRYRLEADVYDWTGSDDIIELCFLSKAQLERLNEYMKDGVDAYEAVKDGGVIVLGYGDTAEQKNIQLYDLKVGDRISFASLKVISEIKKQNEARDDDPLPAYSEISDRKAYDQYIIKGFCRMNSLVTNFPKTVIMSYDYVQDTYGEEFIENYINGIYVNIDEKKFDKESFEDLVGLQPALLSWNYMDPQKEIAEETRIIRYIGIFIVLFIMVLGIVSMLNTMINEQLQRRKENAILRAIGMSRSGLNKMLIMEKMLVGFMAWFIGTAASLLLSWLFTIGFLYMMDTKFKFPWYICGITAVVIFIIMAILSGLMIIMVGKMDITEGIRNEG